MIQSTASLRPALQVESTTGLPTLRFSNGWLELPQSLTIGTLLVVARHEGQTFTRQEGLFSGPDGDTYFYFTGKRTSSGSSPSWMADSSSYLKRRFRNGADVSSGVLQSIERVTLYSGVDTTSDIHKRTRARIYLGRDRASTTNLWSGDILEVIVYSSALGDEDRQAVEKFLMSRYGIV